MRKSVNGLHQLVVQILQLLVKLDAREDERMSHEDSSPNHAASTNADEVHQRMPADVQTGSLAPSHPDASIREGLRNPRRTYSSIPGLIRAKKKPKHKPLEAVRLQVRRQTYDQGEEFPNLIRQMYEATPTSYSNIILHQIRCQSHQLKRS